MKNIIVSAAGLILTLLLGYPASAQDAFEKEVGGVKIRSESINSQTDAITAGQAPMLEITTNKTIAPQAGDAAVVQGVSRGYIYLEQKVKTLTAILNFLAYALGIGGGGVTMIKGFKRRKEQKQSAILQIGLGALCIIAGLLAPGFIDWLTAPGPTDLFS